MKLIFQSLTRETSDINEINNLIRKGWTELASPEQEIVDAQSEEQKLRAEANISFLDKTISGFLVEPENIVLGLREADRMVFSQMLTLVKEALDLGLITNETLQTISDINGQKIQLTTLRLRQVMVAYGFYFKGLWDKLNS